MTKRQSTVHITQHKKPKTEKDELYQIQEWSQILREDMDALLHFL